MLTREAIMDELKRKGYDVESKDVTKNGVELQGIIIGTESVRPTIYADDYLDTDLNYAVNTIINLYKNSQKNPMQFDVQNIMKWDNLKTKLQLCIQKKGNEDIVKRDFLDLEQYVRAIVNMDEEGVGSFKVTPSHLEFLGITEEILFNAAWECTKPTITETNMAELMASMMGMTIEDVLSEMGNTPMQIVLGNQNNVNGAIAMCDVEILSDIAERYNANLVILPSSIHEVIVMPIDDDIDFDKLDDMVNEVNETQVLPTEQLSDHIYKFNRYTKEVTF